MSESSHFIQSAISELVSSSWPTATKASQLASKEIKKTHLQSKRSSPVPEVATQPKVLEKIYASAKLPWITAIPALVICSSAPNIRGLLSALRIKAVLELVVATPKQISIPPRHPQHPGQSYS